MSETQTALTPQEAAEAKAFEDLFATAQSCFDGYLEVLHSYGIKTNPDMRLHRSKGMNSYYNLEDGQIYLALPSMQGGLARLQLLLVKSMFGTESNGDILELFQLLLPRIVAHELGHALRHQYDQFQKDNLWLEEQAANQLAMALIKRHMSPEQKARVRSVLADAIAKLGQKIESKDIALDSYRNILQALDVTKQITDGTLENIEMIGTVFTIDTEDLLRASGQLPVDVLERIDQRDDVINELNEQYTKEAARYTYSHFGWMYYDFLSRQSEYVDEFAVTRLNLTQKLLPEIDASKVLDRVEIQALFRAYQIAAKHSEAAKRYFYKRYRVSLLRRMEATTLDVPGGRVENDLTQLMEMWDEGKPDPLEYLTLICPDELKGLFPKPLAASAETMSILPGRFMPTATDKRFWQYCSTNVMDEELSNTLERLEMLDRIPMLRPLPAELLLWLVHRMYELKLDSNEPVMWAGEKNADIFILKQGLLEISATVEGKMGTEHVGMLGPGEMFGELSFMTNEVASATIRAVRPSVCYVFKGTDLKPMTYNHPAVLVQISLSLAEKLARMNQVVAAQATGATVFMPRGAGDESTPKRPL